MAEQQSLVALTLTTCQGSFSAVCFIQRFAGNLLDLFLAAVMAALAVAGWRSVTLSRGVQFTPGLYR
jgi:hypothetical protein